MRNKAPMKKQLPILLGLLAVVIPAVWISFIKEEQIPDFIKAAIDEPVEGIGLFLFKSREAALAIEYPLSLAYCVALGLLVGFICRFILRKHIP
jgi:hypothetical protein